MGLHLAIVATVIHAAKLVFEFRNRLLPTSAAIIGRVEAKRLFINDALVQMFSGAARKELIESGISGTWLDLLLTDVVLPGGMSGLDIAKAAAARHCDIKVLFISGYTQDSMADLGRHGEDYLLLRKPFRKTELAHKIKEALEAAP